MPPEQLRALLETQPFTPFDIRMNNDRFYHVDNPGQVLVSANRGVAAIDTESGVVIISTASIESLAPIPKNSSAPLD